MSYSGEKSSGAVVDLTWVTEAPIRFVPPDEVPARVRRFKELLAHWGVTEPGPETETPSVSALSADLPSRHPLSKKRSEASGFIAGLVESHGVRSDRPTFEYVVAGEPIALLTLYLRSDGVMEIKDLVTHPGSVDGGGIMVEFALNRIDFYNKQCKAEVFEPGFLQLESYDEDSTAAYLALGFDEDGKDMYLNANKQKDKWRRVGDVWKLVGRPGMFRAKLG